MSSLIDRRRPSFADISVLGLALLLGIAGAPDRAPAQAHEHGAAADTSTVIQLEQATSHLEQMLRTLRDNPSLEETWSSPSVLEAAVAAGRGATGVAREVRALSTTLDSLLRGEAAEQNDALAGNLRQISGSTEEMASSLSSVAGQLTALQSVVHGESGGAGHGHGTGGGHSHGGLHFSHPLFTESVSPDTKIRTDYNVLDLGAQEGTKHEFSLALEYALGRSFSVEAGVPYSASDEALGFTHVSVKFANYALEAQGISLGYGVGVGLPTSGGSAEGDHTHPDGGDHTHAIRASRSGVMSSPPPARANGGSGVHGTLGRDYYEFEPFFNIGWRSGRWELVGFTTFGIPSGMADPSEGGSTLSWNASTLFQPAPEVQTVLELNGSHGLSGHPVAEDVVNLSPGIKLRPSGSSPLWLGIGGSMPATTDQSYDGRLQVSFFYHFY